MEIGGLTAETILACRSFAAMTVIGSWAMALLSPLAQSIDRSPELPAV